MRLQHAVGALLLLQLAAGARAVEAQKAERTRKSDLITAEEIAKSGANNAYDAVKTLRPAWLRTRGAISTDPDSPTGGGIQVYVDGIHVGSTDELNNVLAERVQEMRLVSASDATTKYGTGHTQGVIEVTSKR
jgi:hypothetical protein